MCRFLTGVVTVLVLLISSARLPAADPPKDKNASQDARTGPTTAKEFELLAKQGPKAPWRPDTTGRVAAFAKSIDATVTDVCEQYIEVRPWGKEETVKYPPHELLRTGAVCHYESDSHCYMLRDVKKGDEVMVGVGRAAVTDECFYLKIRQRPGGVIPPSRKPCEWRPYHEERQAEVELVEKGTPIPLHLRGSEEDEAKRLKWLRITDSNSRPVNPPTFPPKKKD